VDPVLLARVTLPAGATVPLAGLTAIVAVTEVPAATVVALSVSVVVVATGTGAVETTETAAELLAVNPPLPAYFAVTV
jgi:1-aminocyclopropane-1-carboxylate deaminase/D-cysteine desulfhydrase-like pyridoxal-dependent ACC family enzyme